MRLAVHVQLSLHFIHSYYFKIITEHDNLSVLRVVFLFSALHSFIVAGNPIHPAVQSSVITLETVILCSDHTSQI